MTPAFFRALRNPATPVPARGMLVLLLVYGAVWLAVLGGTALVPPMDNLEQLVWVRKLQWGYYKHPPLPTALLWPWVQAFGVQVWLTYLLGAAITLGTLGWLWLWLRRVTDSRFATLALSAVLCITFYAGRLYYYNHNVTLLWGTVGAAICAWHALRQPGLRWWLALGLVLGVAALGKYQIGLSVLSLLAYMAWSGAWRDRRHLAGLLLGGLVAMAVFAPHAWWALAQRSNPLNYALASSLEADFGWWMSAKSSAKWLLDQFLNRALLAWALLCFGLWRWRKAQRNPALATTAPAAAPASADNPALRRFLLCFGLLPFGAMVLMGLLGGVDLQMHWGTAYLPLAVPAVMLCWRSVDWPQVLAQPVWRCFVLFQALALAQFALSSAYGVPKWRTSHWRAFDAPRVAQQMAAPARAALGTPIRIVIGGKEAAAVAMYLPERPLVLLGDHLNWSPWISADMLAQCGAVRISADYSRITWRTERSAAEKAAAASLAQTQAASATSAPASTVAAMPDAAAAIEAEEDGVQSHASPAANDAGNTTGLRPAASGVVEAPGSTIAAVRWTALAPAQGAAACLLK